MMYHDYIYLEFSKNLEHLDALMKRLVMGLEEATTTGEVSPRIKALIEETAPELLQGWINHKREQEKSNLPLTPSDLWN